jgi:hypothetical protein
MSDKMKPRSSLEGISAPHENADVFRHRPLPRRSAPAAWNLFRALPESPIIMGHSYGGLFTKKSSKGGVS